MFLQELHSLLEAASTLIQPGKFMLWTDTGDFSSDKYKDPVEHFGGKVKHVSFDKSKMEKFKDEVLAKAKKLDADFDMEDLETEIRILSKTPSRGGGHYEIFEISGLSSEEVTLMKREFHKARRGHGYPDDPDNWASNLINLPYGLTVDGLAKLAVRRWGNPQGEKWFKTSHSF